MTAGEARMKVDANVSEQKREEGLEYISKSRIKRYKTCPRDFYLTYWCENRGPETAPMRRGTQIHDIFEDYHRNLMEYGDFPGNGRSRTSFVPEDATLQFLDPYVGNFWKFEERRRQESDSFEEYIPVSVEEELWLYDPPSGEIPWQGRADAIVNSESLPSFDGDGVVILDYKTGKVPKEEYRDDGIYLEQEFYAMVFEQEYDVDGVAAYYPKKDVLLEAPLSDARRREVNRCVEMIQQEPEPENFPIEEQPLCHYGHGKCHFWDNGCESTWAKPGGPGKNQGEYK